MLDIILIAILVLLIGLPICLIILNHNVKTDEEQKKEDDEQMEYLKKYSANKINKNN